MNPIEMKVMPTPASAESSAARGVWRRIQPPQEGGGDLDHAAEESGDERDFPGEVGVVGLVIDRAENEEDEGEEADGVDAEGQGGDGLAGALGEPVRLPRIEEVSRDERDGDSGQDAADDQRLGQAGERRGKAPPRR